MRRRIAGPHLELGPQHHRSNSAKIDRPAASDGARMASTGNRAPADAGEIVGSEDISGSGRKDDQLPRSGSLTDLRRLVW